MNKSKQAHNLETKNMWPSLRLFNIVYKYKMTKFVTEAKNARELLGSKHSWNNWRESKPLKLDCAQEAKYLIGIIIFATTF